ncbi:MAG: hypothetical protein ACYCW6_19805 [Candidatus Xenobia bacterium]
MWSATGLGYEAVKTLSAEFIGTFIRTTVAAGCGFVAAAGAWHVLGRQPA